MRSGQDEECEARGLVVVRGAGGGTVQARRGCIRFMRGSLEDGG